MDKSTKDSLEDINNKIILLEGQFEGRISLLRTTIKYLSDKVTSLEYDRLKSSEDNKQFILEVGKFYKTRDSKKVIIVCYDEERTKYKYVGMIIGDQAIYSWMPNGCFDNEGRKAANDIIGEWTDEHI